MKKLWIVTVLLLGASPSLAVVNPTDAQQTQQQQTSHTGQQAMEGTQQKEQQVTETRKTVQQTQTVEDETQPTTIEEKEKAQQTKSKQDQKEQTDQPVKEKTQQATSDKKQQSQQTVEGKELQQTAKEAEQHQHYRVLFLYPIASRSYSSFFGGMINALVDRGHHITVMSPHKPFETKDKIRTVQVKEGDLAALVKDPFREHRLKLLFTMSIYVPDLCSDLLARPEVQELLREKFDMVLLSTSYSDCFLSIVHQLKVPFAWVSPPGMYLRMAEMMGNPWFPSFMGSVAILARHPLSFAQRLGVTVFETVWSRIYSSVSFYRAERVCRERGLCPADMPSLHDLARNASLLIHNTVRPLERTSRPAVPAELYVGGIHCRPAKPLPAELEEWVEGAGDAGFIFFSLGSVIKASTMPEETRVALLEAFASLDQRVLWKWDQDTMEDLPPNVRLAKWLPQQDILGHPRLRLFITHGGLMSTIEASYHGVPVLGLPVITDQHSNMLQTQEEGWGRSLAVEDVTAETMREAVLAVMNDADILARAKHRAVMMRDQPMTPAETLVFWVEYVVRHRGAPHLRCPAADMPWYQLYNVDVWATVAVVVLAVAYFTLRLTLALCSCLCCPRSGKSKKD